MTPSLETQINQLSARAQAKSYERGAHKDNDAKVGLAKHNRKTRSEQDRILQRYLMWHLIDLREQFNKEGSTPPDLDTAAQIYLQPGVEPPSMTVVKDFLRFYAATSKPQISDKITTESLVSTAEYFLSGLDRVIGASLPKLERSEIYAWIRKVLTEENVVINKEKIKYNFTVDDVTRIVRTLWTKVDPIYIHERDRVQFTFLIHVYCWTGARIGAFFKGGLRYKDIDLALQRTTKGKDEWRIIYLIRQRWIKNNRDPENIVYGDSFGAAAREHELLVYNETACLLALAFADKALFGFETLADLQLQTIPKGQDFLILRFNDHVLDLPILRKCSKTKGVLEEPMTAPTFKRIFDNLLQSAGYLCSASIHSIRRALGKKVDERYTPVQRSQHLTQSDLRVFGQSYVANCSSVDGQAAYRGEQSDHSHIEYFQGSEQFREEGLPTKLPAALRQKADEDPALELMRLDLANCTGKDSKVAKQKYQAFRQKIQREALKDYQRTWASQQRDKKILSRGYLGSASVETDASELLFRFFPCKARLARLMSIDQPLGSEEKWLAVLDLLTLCNIHLDVLYLPNAKPTEGRCPVNSCQLELETLKMNKRSAHIHSCLIKDIANRHEQLPSNIRYCYLCFDWVVGSDYEPHCQAHVNRLTSKQCGSLVHNHTLVRPAYCPFCMGSRHLPAAKRLTSYIRDDCMKEHLMAHLTHVQFPAPCPHPLCECILRNEDSFRFHLVDHHRLSIMRKSSTSLMGPTTTVAGIKRSAFERELTWYASFTSEDLAREIFSKKRRVVQEADDQITSDGVNRTRENSWSLVDAVTSGIGTASLKDVTYNPCQHDTKADSPASNLDDIDFDEFVRMSPSPDAIEHTDRISDQLSNTVSDPSHEPDAARIILRFKLPSHNTSEKSTRFPKTQCGRLKGLQLKGRGIRNGKKGKNGKNGKIGKKGKDGKK